MNNEKIEKYSTEWYEKQSYDDTRFYGVFVKHLNTENQSVSVDMKRFCEYFRIDDDRRKLKSNPKSQLYKPSKSHACDYNMNYIVSEMNKIKSDWSNQKVFIAHFLYQIKGKTYSAIDDDNLQMGYVDYDEAYSNARMQTYLSEKIAENMRQNLYMSLYGQYFHQLSSQIDAVIIRLLTLNGWEGETYNRDVLLACKGLSKHVSKETIKNLKSYYFYNKMYNIWNFLKHNTTSTFSKIKDENPEVLNSLDYSQGDLGCYYMNISDDLIDEVFEGVSNFLIDYCRIVFKEDEEKSKWDYEDYFLSYVYGEINDQNDPIGLSHCFY